MDIQFNSNTRLGEIQNQFSALFPHLKIGFFNDLNGDHKLTANEQMRDEHMEIQELLGRPVSGTINIDGKMLVSELESTLLTTYGMAIQVFRKSGNTWLVTQQTDSRSLDEQESIAKEMSHPVEQPEPGDYHEMD